MKLLCCNNCHSVIPLSRHIQSCRCGNADGKYMEDGKRVAVWIKEGEEQTTHLVGIENRVRYGFALRGDCFLISWKDRTVTKYVKTVT